MNEEIKDNEEIEDKDVWRTVCFTGPLPRRLWGYNEQDPRYIALAQMLEACVADLVINKGYTRFISGGAQGIDQLAFWAVDRVQNNGYKIENNLYIPFEGQDRIWKAEGFFSREQYRAMRSLTSKENKNKPLTSEHIVRTITDFSDKDAISNAMLARNEAMVNHSAVVFGVYYDNTWLDVRAKNETTDPGTAYTLQYGFKQEKTCVVLNPVTLQFIYTTYRKEE